MIIFVAGVAVLSYPLVSAVINNIESRGKATAYMNKVESMPDPEIEQFFDDAETYNKSLINNQGTVNTSDYTSAALNMASYGIYDNIYCYISAPSIGMRLPVYLGANDYNMNFGAAHLCNTLLPISGGDSNAAISAHTGYIGRIFFDNIKHLEYGDEISVRNYFETLDYRVIDKKIVDEHDSRDLYIESGKQLLTLITCISNDSGGFDRYIVICEKKN